MAEDLDEQGAFHGAGRVDALLVEDGSARRNAGVQVLIFPDERACDTDDGPGFQAQGVQIGELFRDFNRVGVTVVLATHDLQLAARLQPRLVEIRGGRIAS